MSTDFFVGPRSEPDRIRLGPAVASGSEGVLYRGFVETANAPIPIAVKMLQPGHLGRLEDWTARWRHQSELLQRVKLPGLVTVRGGFIGALPHPQGEADASTTSLYLVMDWIDGVALDRWSRSIGTAEPEQLLQTLVPVAAALDILHSGAATNGEPVVHRDIKPANILVRPGGDTVLVDLGSVRGMRDQHRAGVAGTPGYIAPEVLEGADPGPAADRYSLGAVAFFLLAGHEPSAGADEDALRRTLLDAPLVGGREEVADHVVEMLAADPEARPRSLANWVAQLRRSSLSVLPGDMTIAPVAARRQPGIARGADERPRRRRRRVIVLTAAILLSAAGTAAAVGLTGTSHPRPPQKGSTTTSSSSTSTTELARSTTIVPTSAALPDFNNMTYPAKACGPTRGPVEVRNGGRAPQNPDDYPAVSVQSITPTELDGKAPPEVVVLLGCAYAMTDHSTSATVWAAKNGAYRMAAVVPPLGGKAPDYGGHDASSVTDFDYYAHPILIASTGGMFEVTEQVYEGSDSNCCPSTLTRTTYKFDGAALTVVGTPVVLAKVRDDQSSNYPYLTLLDGAAHGFDVTAVANADVLQKLRAVDLKGATFPTPLTCTATTKGGQRCKVEVQTGQTRRTFAMTAHEDTEGKMPTPVDAAGAVRFDGKTWFVDTLSIS